MDDTVVWNLVWNKVLYAFQSSMLPSHVNTATRLPPYTHLPAMARAGKAKLNPAKVKLSKQESRAAVNKANYEKNQVHIRKHKRVYMRNKRAGGLAAAGGGPQGDHHASGSGQVSGKDMVDSTIAVGPLDSDEELDEQLAAFRQYEETAALEGQIERLEGELAETVDLAEERLQKIVHLEGRIIDLQHKVESMDFRYEVALNMRVLEEEEYRKERNRWSRRLERSKAALESSKSG